jgi:NOL1/NOP2/sun family putative RNA methylase
MNIPEPFRERYCGLADEPDAFLASLTRPLPRAFRVNTLKCSSKEIQERFSSYDIPVIQMPWYGDAFISEEPDIGGTLEHFLGNIYLQELVSMLPPLALLNELGDAKSVLDACAAPGSKTTQLAAMKRNKGTIIANDVNYGRIRALRFNLEKTGTLNTVITNYDLRNFPQSRFDLILLDAPCSAEGTMRKNPGLTKIWSPKQIAANASLQKQLITKAFDLLADNGVLLYSTCTFAPEENEAVLDWLLEKREAEIEKINIPGFKFSFAVNEWKGRAFDPQIKNALRVWPHHNDTGGFFMAKVRK